MIIICSLIKEMCIAFKINGKIFANWLIYLQIKNKLYISSKKNNE